MQDTKKIILDTAQNLFYTIGYETTSIQTIIDTVGIAKGTFYHHFKSKEELLDKLIERLSDTIIGTMGNVAEDTSLNALEKLNKAFTLAGQIKVDTDNVEVIIVLTKNFYKESNIRMLHKITEKVIKITVPILAKIIKQGVEEKLFDTRDPEYMGELIMRMGVFIQDKFKDLLCNIDNVDPNEAAELFINETGMLQTSVERMLLTEPGSINFYEPDLYYRFFRKLKERGGLNDQN